MRPAGLDVAIDGRPLVGNRTGIGVHTAEIARRLSVEPPPLIASHAEIRDRTGIEHCRFSVQPARFGLWWQLLTFPGISERSDVVWGPHGTIPPGLRVPAVVSVHDLTSITAPHHHRLKTIASFNLLIRRSLDQARFVAAVSQTTADQVVRGFAIDRSKIAVIPNGVDEFFRPDPTGSSGRSPQEPYILYVGTFEPRKGIDDLFDAWLALGGRRPRLVIAGDPGWHHRRLRAAMHYQKGIDIRGFVTREDLRQLYRGAICLAYPSKFEGFGLPPLEAMACGTPVVATRAGAIPEVLGDAALLVAPGDREELRDALRRVLSDEPLRIELREKGLERSARFRWDRSAGLMQELLVAAAN